MNACASEGSERRAIKAAFVGHFSPPTKVLDAASSVAGNQVQLRISRELSEKCGIEHTVNYSMTPQAHWPQGSIVLRSSKAGMTEFIGYLNLPVLKHMIFSIRLLLRLLAARPNLCLQYNSYFFENLSFLLYRFFHRGSALALIIQDIHVAVGVPMLSKRGLRSLSERASLRLSRCFDLIVPISSAIITDFHFEASKCFVFQGGITEFAVQLMRGDEQKLLDIGVFAGGLEPHNGVDRLVDQWLASGIQQQLHVFGRGSLEWHIEQAATQSDRIVFHGFQPEHVVLAWQSKARWNFCLRYSLGLNQT